MNEVEKMYENAGVKKYKKSYCGWDSNCPYPYHKCNDECPYYEYEDNEQYPPFTAEKQLELIKWLMCKKQTIQVELRLYENDYCISHITECEHNDAVEYVETGRKNTFDEALAELVNELWQDLTEEEHKQIKEILE